MTSGFRPTARRRGARAGRTAAALAAMGCGVAGLTACGDSAGPDAGDVTLEDLHAVEDRLAHLQDRIGALEDGVGAGTGDVDDSAPFFEDSGSYVGGPVTVSGDVLDLVTTSDLGGAFRIAGESGHPVAVVSAAPPPELVGRDVVRVTGTVTEVRRASFDEDFGIAADELFEDADGWFEEEEGRIAISADRIEVLQEQGDS